MQSVTEAVDFVQRNIGAIISVGVTLALQAVVGLVALGMILQQLGDVRASVVEVKATVTTLADKVGSQAETIARVDERTKLWIAPEKR